VPTFEQCAREYIRSHEASWKNDKHRAQWPSTLMAYVYPVIGKRPVDQVGIEDILAILKPIWTTKAPTAGNIRGRMDKVLGWATAMGHRTGDNPASRDGPLPHLLPSIGKMKRDKKHHAAVPYKEVPVVVADLRKLGSTSATALVFTILTAARTGETLGATWDEIDLEAKLWTMPAQRMKAAAEHLRLNPKRFCLPHLGDERGRKQGEKGQQFHRYVASNEIDSIGSPSGPERALLGMKRIQALEWHEHYGKQHKVQNQPIEAEMHGRFASWLDFDAGSAEKDCAAGQGDAGETQALSRPQQ
jgi:integrase